MRTRKLVLFLLYKKELPIMKTSSAGINLIKKYEGCRLTAYKCPANVYTIGYGHTKGVKQGMKITKAQAEAYLKQDLVTYENAVNKYVKVPINQNQFDALVSFSFNCGTGALKTSTLLRELNKKDYSGAAKQFLKWNKSNGKVLNGLTKRRKEERELFMKKEYLSNKTYKGKSIVEALKEINVDSSYEYRKKLAEVNKINDYMGLPEQNIRMLNLLINGKLIKG
jgi:GH24 family phage-related lysozyme (muramidase)